MTVHQHVMPGTQADAARTSVADIDESDGAGEPDAQKWPKRRVIRR
jgi:hypothetical protein